jgi:hypothetical protein
MSLVVVLTLITIGPYVVVVFVKLIELLNELRRPQLGNCFLVVIIIALLLLFLALVFLLVLLLFLLVFSLFLLLKLL